MKEQMSLPQLVFAYTLNQSRTLNFIMVKRNAPSLPAIKTVDGSLIKPVGPIMAHQNENVVAFCGACRILIQ
jgi:hypothetical protein